jgi:hypothetical protein
MLFLLNFQDTDQQVSGFSWTSDGACTPLLDTSRERHPQTEKEMERERVREGIWGPKASLLFFSFLFVYEVLSGTRENKIK